MEEGIVCISRVQARGYVTIPKRIRDWLDIRKGTYLLWEPLGENKIIITKLNNEPKAFPVCPRCGYRNVPLDANFCPYCGYKFHESPYKPFNESKIDELLKSSEGDKEGG